MAPSFISRNYIIILNHALMASLSNEINLAEVQCMELLDLLHAAHCLLEDRSLDIVYLKLQHTN